MSDLTANSEEGFTEGNALGEEMIETNGEVRRIAVEDRPQRGKERARSTTREFDPKALSTSAWKNNLMGIRRKRGCLSAAPACVEKDSGGRMVSLMERIDRK